MVVSRGVGRGGAVAATPSPDLSTYPAAPGGNGSRPSHWAAVAAARLLLAVLVTAVLVRAARTAWLQRRLALTVWGRIRPRHIAGSAALAVVVVSVAVGLSVAVPATGLGLGSVLGLTGNAVFAPIEEAASRSGAASPLTGGAGGVSWPLSAGTAAFLLLVAALFPWLAYAEERTFRMGLEHAGLLAQVRSALRFGLVHLVMLIPVAAALAIGVAGFAYGRIYRRAYFRALQRPGPRPGAPAGPATVIAPEAAVLAASPTAAREAAVLAATVWHATFNTLIVGVVLFIVLAGGLSA